jgi:type III pantothenate kinase
MSTTLCIDLGNTRSKYAFFKNGVFEGEQVAAEATVAAFKPIIEAGKPSHIILCSVTNHGEALEAYLSSQASFIKLSAETKLPVSIHYDSPATLGPDRIALVAGANAAFPGKNSLVIGMGTCITFNFINQFSQFLGGSISPGMKMRFQAMHEYTHKLPLCTPSHIFPLIGYNTRQSVTSGVMQGIIAEIHGIIDLYQQRYHNFNVILTGGDSSYFAPLLKNKIFADPFLIYKGLNAISECNKHESQN